MGVTQGECDLRGLYDLLQRTMDLIGVVQLPSSTERIVTPGGTGRVLRLRTCQQTTQSILTLCVVSVCVF